MVRVAFRPVRHQTATSLREVRRIRQGRWMNRLIRRARPGTRVTAADDRFFQNGGTPVTPSRRGSAPSLQIIESCNSTWMFDAKGKRFRRVPKGTPLDLPTSAADWETYVKLEID